MGIFSSKKSGDRAAAKERQFQEAIEAIEPLDIAAEFPSASDEDSNTMEQIWVMVVSNVGGAGTFEPRQIAAITTLCERLSAGNPALTGFVRRLQQVAEAEHVRRPADAGWKILADRL